MKRLLTVLTVAILLTGCINTEKFETTTEVNEPETAIEETVAEPEEVATPDKVIEPVETHDATYYMICENNTEAFATNEEWGAPHGVFTLSGEIITSNELEPWTENEYVDFLRLKVTGGNETAIDYYAIMASEGNTINDVGMEDDLYFTIGLLEDGEISSTAEITEDARNLIMDSAANGTEIELTMTVPLYEGRGAPSNFSWACLISTS